MMPQRRAQILIKMFDDLNGQESHPERHETHHLHQRQTMHVSLFSKILLNLHL